MIVFIILTAILIGVIIFLVVKLKSSTVPPMTKITTGSF
jgi:hypothetical protein